MDRLGTSRAAKAGIPGHRSRVPRDARISIPPVEPRGLVFGAELRRTARRPNAARGSGGGLSVAQTVGAMAAISLRVTLLRPAVLAFLVTFFVAAFLVVFFVLAVFAAFLAAGAAGLLVAAFLVVFFVVDFLVVFFVDAFFAVFLAILVSSMRLVAASVASPSR